MVKVRMSQIPQESGLPQRRRTSGQNTRERFVQNEDFEEDDDDEEEGSEKEDMEVRYTKAVVLLEDFGIMFPLYEISTIDKDMQFVERPKAHWQYGITINKGMDASIRYPRVNVSTWFEREEVRDESFDRIMKKLEENGFHVIKT